MTEITVTSGAKVVMNVADFDDVMTLKNTAVREASRSGLVGSIKFDSDVSALLGLAATLDSSPEVYAAIWPCLARCLYNGEKITKKTFEPVEARKDYYDVVLKCLEVNLSPFFENLLSKFQMFRGNLLSKDAPK